MKLDKEPTEKSFEVIVKPDEAVDCAQQSSF
jgi:hypothetical protein